MSNPLDLNLAISEIEKSIKNLESQYEKEFETYIEALKVKENPIKNKYEPQITELKRILLSLKSNNEVCEQCKGKGKILRSRVCVEDDSVDLNDPNNWETRDMCRGSGLEKDVV